MKQPVTNSKTVVSYDPFHGPAIEKVVPITQSQAEIWISCALGGDNASRAYNESITLILEGELNYDALDSAIQQLAQRHEAIRSIFSPNGHYMIVLKYEPFQVDQLDITHQSENEREQSLSDYISADANYIFDIINGPLMKMGLIKTDNLEHHLVITGHHILCDGWSLGTILYELGILYSAIISNTIPSLPDADSFSVFADELQLYESSEEYINTVQFWLGQYKNSIPQLNLPIDYPRPEVRTFKSERLDIAMDKELIANFKAVGIKYGCSFVTTLMAAFEILLRDQTGQEDIVVGLPSAGQAATGRNHLIGHCVNLLPLRSKLKDNQPFSDYLKDRKLAILDAYDHQQLSFGKLLQELHIQRDPSRVPLVPVVFNLDTGMDSNVHFTNLNFKLESNPRAFGTFELVLNVSEEENGLILEWSYNTSLFKSSTIEQMMSSFEEIMVGIVANPNIKIGEIIKIDKPTKSELDNAHSPSRIPVLKTANSLNDDSSKGFTESENLVDIFISQVKKTPNNTAIVFEAKNISYKELDILSNQFANYIIDAHNIKVNDLVSVMLERSEWVIVCVMGILKSGAAYVPIDPNYPEKRKKYIIEDCQSKIIIDRDFITGFINELDTLSPILNEAIQILPKSLSYIIYTSGTTGNPKGVMIEHKSVVNLIASQTKSFKIDESEHILQFSNYCFDASVEQIFLALLNGAALFMIDKRVLLNNRLPEFLKSHEITHLHATPSFLETLPDLSNISSLKRIVAGGEPCSKNLAERLAKGCDFYNKYGPTEATVTSTMYKYNSQITNTPILSIGKPIDNTQAYIVSEKLELLSVGQEGELCVSGKSLARGYLNKPELTAEKFINNPFLQDEKMYRTGDYAKWDSDGNLEFIGRRDDQVKIRGYRIELLEVEASINSLPSIKRAVVTTSRNLAGELSIIAFLQPINKQSDSNTIKNQLKQLMPEFQIPSAITWVKNFPLTTNGKVDRSALLKLVTNGVKSDGAMPSTPSEKIIAKIWQDCLQLEQIDINSDFFEIGGHSLIGVKVMAKLEKDTGKRIPLVGLLKHPTIKKFAAYMDSEFFTWDSLVPLKLGGTKPPLYIVHGANHQVLIFNDLAQYLDEDQPVYGLQSRGLNGVAEPHDSIDEMVADYIAEIVASNPDGPYALAGFSYGGKVAYEMARQMRAQGKEVKILAQFDTYVFPVYCYKNPIVKKVISISYNVGKMVYLLFNMFSSKKNFKRRIELLKLKVKGVHLRLKYGKEKQYEEQFNVSSKMYSNHNLAASKYTITPQDIVIDLFRADEEVNFVLDPDYLGWKKIAKKGVRKHMVRGNHVDMFEKPHVKDFADKLQQVLDNYNLESFE